MLLNDPVESMLEYILKNDLQSVLCIKESK